MRAGIGPESRIITSRYGSGEDFGFRIVDFGFLTAVFGLRFPLYGIWLRRARLHLGSSLRSSTSVFGLLLATEAFIDQRSFSEVGGVGGRLLT